MHILGCHLAFPTKIIITPIRKSFMEHFPYHRESFSKCHQICNFKQFLYLTWTEKSSRIDH